MLRFKIADWLPLLALILLIGGQLAYLPSRLALVRDLLTFAPMSDVARTRLAYQPADFDLLEWVRQTTPPDATLLLVTANPQTYGDPSYVLYHRALYHLAPRMVWWAAPVRPTRYPAWWLTTDLSEADILALAQQHHVDAILADGFAAPPITGPTKSFDADTHLIFLTPSVESPRITDNRSLMIDNWPLVTGHWSLVIRIFGALLSLLLWGDLIYRLCGRWLGVSMGLRLAIAWLFGCGVASLLLFILLWANISLTHAVFFSSFCGALLWFFILRHPIENHTLSRITHHASRTTHHTPFIIHYSLFTILLLQTTLALLAAFIRPLTDWDAWVNWTGKANLLFIEQGLSTAVYNDPARLPTNLDYPLLLPLVETWFYTWLGHIDDRMAAVVSALFYVALLLLFYDAARRLVSPTAALGFTTVLAIVPRVERLAYSGLADVPLAALVLLAVVMLWWWFEAEPDEPSANIPAVILIGFAVGLLPWLKNEGWLWWTLLMAGWLFSMVIKWRSDYASRSQTLKLAILYGLTAVTVPILWQIFLWLNGTQEFTFMPLTLTNLWLHLPRYPIIIVEIGKRLLDPAWNFVWLLVGLTFLLRRIKIFRARGGWLIWLVVGYLFLVSLIYIFSRFDPYLAHLNNSVDRLALQALPLVVLWLAGQWQAVKEGDSSSE